MSRRRAAATDHSAVYAIHIAGAVGPMLVSSLVDASSGTCAAWKVRTRGASVVLVSVTEADLVDVVRRLADDGVEIDCVRELGARDAGALRARS